jgi:hypothetical protein
MSFLSRLIHTKVPERPIVKPDDRHLDRALNRAKRENDIAVSNFIEATEKNERDAELARFVISEVLERADHVKANGNGHIKK